jgi:hypothetical protein
MKGTIMSRTFKSALKILFAAAVFITFANIAMGILNELTENIRIAIGG